MSDAALPPLPPDHQHHPRWLLPTLTAGLVLLVIASNVGNMLWASWVVDRPLGLLVLNSSNKYLVATSISLDLVPMLVVATLRLLAPDPLFFAMGWLYGERALHWARRTFPGIEPLLDRVDDDPRLVHRVLNVLVVVAPNNPVCLVAGVVRYPIGRFVVLNVVGTVGRVLLMRWIGLLFEDQIEDVLEVVDRYQTWLLWGSIALVAGLIVWQVVADRGLAGSIDELDEELGED
jgi:membrane protein DedA with SNARE-associated domain